MTGTEWSTRYGCGGGGGGPFAFVPLARDRRPEQARPASAQWAASGLTTRMTQPAEAGLLQSLSPLLYYYDQIYPNHYCTLRKISTTSAASLLFALAPFSFLLKKNPPAVLRRRESGIRIVLVVVPLSLSRYCTVRAYDTAGITPVVRPRPVGVLVFRRRVETALRLRATESTTKAVGVQWTVLQGAPMHSVTRSWTF